MKTWFPFLTSSASIYKVDIGSTTLVHYLLSRRTKCLVADVTVWNLVLQKKPFHFDAVRVVLDRASERFLKE